MKKPDMVTRREVFGGKVCQSEFYYDKVCQSEFYNDKLCRGVKQHYQERVECAAPEFDAPAGILTAAT